MKLSHALFSCLMYGWIAVLVISFWANKLGKGLSCLGMVITGIISCGAICIFLMYAPDEMFTPAIIISIIIVVITLIANWIFGNE